MTKVDGSELGMFQDAKPACIFRIVDSDEKNRYFLSERTNLVYTCVLLLGCAIKDLWGLWANS